MKILFSTERGIVATLIRLFTMSRWSHVSILVDNDTLIESNTKGGVQMTAYKDRVASFKRAEVYTFNMDPKMEALILEFARSQLGKKYDWWAICGFVFRHTDWQTKERWTCSELIAAAFEYGGHSVFRQGKSNRITPEHWYILEPADSRVVVLK